MRSIFTTSVWKHTAPANAAPSEVSLQLVTTGVNELPDATESGPPSSLLNRPFTSNLTQVCSVIHASFWNARSSPGLPQRREQIQKGQGSKSTRGDTPLSSERGTMALHFAYFTITWEDIRFHCCDGGSRPSIESTSTRDARRYAAVKAGWVWNGWAIVQWSASSGQSTRSMQDNTRKRVYGSYMAHWMGIVSVRPIPLKNKSLLPTLWSVVRKKKKT